MPPVKAGRRGPAKGNPTPTFVLSREQFSKFQAALDAPPKPLPRLQRLLSEPSFSEAYTWLATLLVTSHDNDNAPTTHVKAPTSHDQAKVRVQPLPNEIGYT